MNLKERAERIGLILIALVPALLAVQCVEDSTRAQKLPGNESSSGGAGGSEDGATFGPVLMCGKRTVISECDPVTSDECDEGTSCARVAAFGGFKCLEREAPSGPGEFCDNETAFCGAGLFCEITTLSVCMHWCCDDSDCVEGACYGEFYLDGEATVGACYDEYGGKCAFPDDDGNLPEECFAGAGGASVSIDSAGAGGSAP